MRDMYLLKECSCGFFGKKSVVVTLEWLVGRCEERSALSSPLERLVCEEPLLACSLQLTDVCSVAPARRRRVAMCDSWTVVKIRGPQIENRLRS